MKRSYRLGLFVLASLGATACANDSTPTAGPSLESLARECGDDDGVNLDDIASGRLHALCDHQNLTASFLANDPKARAGAPGRLAIPFNVLREGPREYCFRDDNEEKHRLTIVDTSGAAVASLVAGEACVTASLAPGRYTVQATHHRPGVADLPRNTLHTFPERSPSGVPRLVFATNECRGCTITGAWPIDENGKYGLVGEYYGGEITNARCCAGGSPCECELVGAFVNTKMSGLVYNLTLDGAFQNVDMRALTVSSYQVHPITFRGSFSGQPFTLSQQRLVLLERPQVSESFSTMLSNAIVDLPPSAGGAEPVTGRARLIPYLRDGSRTAVYGGTVDTFIDLDDVLVFRDQPADIISFVGTKFPKLPPLASGAPVDFSRVALVQFQGATLRDGPLTTKDPRFGGSLSFDNCTLENVTITPPTVGGALPKSWVLPNLFVSSSTLRGVTIVSEGAGTGPGGSWVASVAPSADIVAIRRSTIDGLSFHHAKVNDLTLEDDVVRNASFAGSVFTKAQVLGGTFARSAVVDGAQLVGSTWRGVDTAASAKGTLFTGAAFADMKNFDFLLTGAGLERVTLTFAPGYGGQTRLSAPQSRWMDAKLTGVVFDGASFSDADLSRFSCANCQLLETVFSRANLSGARLTDSVLDRAQFNRANLTGATLGKSAVGAQFDDADLTSADLTSLDLTRASASDALLCNANLTGVTMSGANLYLARMRTTSQACTVDARGLAGLASDGTVTCPDGTKGPCGSWDVPVGDQCCKPGVGTVCPKVKGAGASCAHRCDCASGVCTGNVCG